MIKVGRRPIVMVMVIAVGLLTWGGVALGQPGQAPSPLKVTMAAGVNGDLVTYVMTLQNTGSSDLAHVFIAGSVPAGAEFVQQASTPSGSWFRGFEGAGTSIQAAVWLAERIPAGGALGPFIYQVRNGKAADLGAHGWVHWLRPDDGTAMSPHLGANAGPLLGMAPDGAFHTTHATRLGLQCAVCHVQQVNDYEDPLAQVFNLADRKACLGCHGSGRTFYGDAWQESSVSK